VSTHVVSDPVHVHDLRALSCIAWVWTTNA